MSEIQRTRINRRRRSNSHLRSVCSSSSETNTKVLHERLPVEGAEYCLARAIQAHVKLLADRLPFKECELADEVVKRGCITEDECNDIRTKCDRKAQVRDIVLIVRTRSYRVMENFLDAAREHCPEIVEDIWKVYNRNIAENLHSSKRICSICSLKASVDVKRVIDLLWSEDIIDDVLVREVNASNEVIGRQGQFWKAIFVSLTNNKRGIELLCQALEAGGHYTHISSGLRKFLNQNLAELQCTCSDINDVGLSKHRMLSQSNETTKSSEEESVFPGETTDSERERTDIELDNMAGEKTLNCIPTGETPVEEDRDEVQNNIPQITNTYELRSDTNDFPFWKHFVFCGRSYFKDVIKEED